MRSKNSTTYFMSLSCLAMRNHEGINNKIVQPQVSRAHCCTVLAQNMCANVTASTNVFIAQGRAVSEACQLSHNDSLVLCIARLMKRVGTLDLPELC
jgi:hypothetical protein